MAEISIKEAIATGWASRATIYRAIKAGEITIRKTPTGNTLVETAELIRVFGEPRLKEEETETEKPGVRPSSLAVENAVMKERIEALERERSRLEREISEAKDRESWLKDQVDKQTMLLTSAQEAQAGGFWGSLFRKKTSP